jgi:Tol biopolymer transport system component/anti-sigma factor RsiW
MNCEQVEELLSAYLDNALAPAERREVAAHLQTCSSCNIMLVEFIRNDALLSHLPRVSPDPALRERIFSSPEFLGLTGTFDASREAQEDWTIPRLPARSPRRDTPGRPQLVAIPGGRSTSPTPSIKPATQQRERAHKRRNSRGLRAFLLAIAASVLLTIAVGSVFGINFWLHQTQTANNRAITPPTGLQQSGPLSAGMRFVFLRGGALWSVLANGSSKQADRLTPLNVTVAENWVVSPGQAGRSAGDMLAYIDLQTAFVHTIRSDGQQDTIIKQPLLKANVQPMSVWDTDTGATILNSLAWSKDGSMLAFVADSAGTGMTKLYIYSTETGTVQMVQVSGNGSVSHPVWSPDGIRLAFEFTNNRSISILDYNIQNHGLLTITNNIESQANTADTVLTLDWSPSLDVPAITWSVGEIGHVHSLSIRRVGVDGATGPRQLLVGDYVQAIYSRNGHNGIGSWLVVTSVAGRAGDLLRVDLTPGSGVVQLTSGKQVSFVRWSPDGMHIDYLDALSSGVGTLHIVNLISGVDSVIARSVVNDPALAWSADGQELAYSTGTQIGVVNLQARYQTLFLKLKGAASAFAWFATASHQLVVALRDVYQGIYLVDTQRNTSLQLDKQGTGGPIEWTEIP